jgi:hypothetical protein
VVCGAAHPTGLRLRVFAGDGVSTYAEVDVTVEHQGQPGFIHGGLLAAAFDEIMGAVNWLIGHRLLRADSTLSTARRFRRVGRCSSGRRRQAWTGAKASLLGSAVSTARAASSLRPRRPSSSGHRHTVAARPRLAPLRAFPAGRAYCPVQSGARLSANARGPAVRSVLALRNSIAAATRLHSSVS